MFSFDPTPRHPSQSQAKHETRNPAKLSRPRSRLPPSPLLRNRNARLAKKHRCDGVHTTGQAPEAERVQISGRGPQLSLPICVEAVLHPCSDQVLSDVDGVSLRNRENKSEVLTKYRPNLVSIIERSTALWSKSRTPTCQYPTHTDASA